MYCQKCGQELTENAQFCNYCGAQQEQTAQPNTQQYQSHPTQQYTAPNQMPNQPQYQPPYQPQANIPYSQPNDVKPKNKNGKKIIISVAVVVIALLVGKLIGSVVIVPSLSDDTDTDSSYTSSTESDDVDNRSDDDTSSDTDTNTDENTDINEDTDTDTDTYSNGIQNDNETSSNSSSSAVNSEYTEIFSSRNIVDGVEGFLMLDSATFAKVDEIGMIDKLEYGYDGDVVKEMVNTIYFPISDYTEAQKNELDTTIKEEFSELENLNCCTMSYNTGNNYYVITVKFTDLDNLDNVQALQELDEITMYGPSNSLISMKNTEESLLADGYVKK